MEKKSLDTNPAYYNLFIILGMFSYFGWILYLVAMKSKGVYIVSNVANFNFKVGIGCAILGKIFAVFFKKLKERDYFFMKNIIGCLANLTMGILVAAAFSIFVFIAPSLSKV